MGGPRFRPERSDAAAQLASMCCCGFVTVSEWALSSVCNLDPATWGCLLLDDGTEEGLSYRRARLLERKRSPLIAGTGGRRARDDHDACFLKRVSLF